MSARSRRRARTLAIAIAASAGSLLAALTFAPSDAAGQKPAAPSADRAAAKPKAAPDAGDRYDPENITAISQFTELVGKGTEKYGAKDYPAAVDLFKKAIQLSPRNPLGSYLLGETYLTMANFGEAEAAFKAAEENSDAKQPLVRSHVLFAMADLYERQKKWEQARTAWQTYTEHAAKIGADAGAYPQTGAARIKAVDDWMKLDKQYEIVRQRIAAEKTAAADAGPDAAKAPAKK